MNKTLTRENVIEAAKNAVKKTGRPISHKEFVKISGVTEYQITCLFPEGGWLARIFHRSGGLGEKRAKLW